MNIRYNINPDTQDPDYSGVIVCKGRFDVEFEVPLWDVRDGDITREKASNLEKLSNAERGSKYIPKIDKFQ